MPLNPRYIVLFCVVGLSAAASLEPGGARAQEPGTTADANLYSGTTVTHTAATVVKIEPASNTVTLREENGTVSDVVVDRAVGDVKRLRIGDHVDISYTRGLVLSAEKAASTSVRERVDTQTITPASGGTTQSSHRVQAIATVLGIDRQQRQLTLRGPTGPIKLQASTDRFLEGLAVGDTVRVDYVEATALQITRDGAPLQ